MSGAPVLECTISPSLLPRLLRLVFRGPQPVLSDPPAQIACALQVQIFDPGQSAMPGRLWFPGPARQARDHARRDGEKIIAEAARHFGWGASRTEDFKALPRGDLRRVAVAWSLARRTSLKQAWITDRIGLGSADNVSTPVRKLSARSKKELSPAIRAWMKGFQ